MIKLSDVQKLLKETTDETTRNLCTHYLESRKVSWSDEKHDKQHLLQTIGPGVVLSVGDVYRKHKSDKWTASIMNSWAEDFSQDFDTKQEAMVCIESLAKDGGFVVQSEQ